MNATEVKATTMNREREISIHNKALVFIRRYTLVVALTIFFIYQLIKFAKLSILDFDGHHDGYILASAIGVSEGRILYRDVFWQYGPLQPYLLAALIKALPFLSPLIVVRLTGLVSILVVFLVVLLQPTLRRQRKSEVLCMKLMVATLFLLLQDQYYGVPFLFWSNHLLILFLVLSFDLLLKQIKKADEHFKAQYKQGIYLSLIVLTRPQFFFILLLIFSLMIVHLRIRNETNRFPLLFLGFIGPLFIGVLLLIQHNALDDFVQQTWSFPRAEYSTQLVVDFFQISLKIITNNLMYGAALIILLANYLVKFLNPLSYFKVISLLALTVVYKSFFGNSSIWAGSLVYPARNSIVFLEIAFLTSLLICLFFAIINIARLAFMGVIDRGVTMSHLIVICIASVSLGQSFPVFDTRHTNWAILGLVSLVVALLTNLPRKYQRVWLIFGLSLITALFFETQKTSKAYEDLVRLKGSREFVSGDVGAVTPHDSMLIWLRRSSSLESEFQFLKTIFKDDESAIFLSGDAAFSVFDGSWRSTDKWFVNWGPVPWLSGRIKEAKYPLIVWDELSAGISERNQVYLSGYELVDQMGRLWVYRIPGSGI
jgi:hypothetical protein